MKIEYKKVEEFLKAIPSGVNAFLFYGPDSGLVYQRSQKLIDSNLDDKINLFEMNFANLGDSFLALENEACSISLLGGKKIILIRGAKKTLGKDLESLILKNSQSFFIITAGDLPPAASTRKFFEKTKSAAAIACYKDELFSIRRIIQNSLFDSGITIRKDALILLESFIGGDRLLIVNELEKLETYLGDSKTVTVDDVSSGLFSNSNAVSLDDLCAETFNKELNKFFRDWDILSKQGVNAIVLLRSLIKYCIRLYVVRQSIQQEKTVKQAMSELRPPVFFKYEQIFSTHVRKYNNEKLLRILTEAYKLEKKLKTESIKPSILSEHYVIENFN
jgi:DNA polymerase III subunit delta